MNLLFRLLWIMLRARLSSKTAAPQDIVRLNLHVWLTDQDMFMHMTNSRYLSFGDLGRVDALIRTGLRRALDQQGWQAEICAQTMTINRMLKFPNRFTLETQIHAWNDRYIAIGQTFLRRGRNHATVNTVLQIQTESGDTVPPADLFAQLEANATSPAMPETFEALIAQLRDA